MHYASTLELKFRDTEAGSVSGYGAHFNNVDHARDRIEPGAFKRTLSGRKSLPMLHEHAQAIGVWKSFREDDKGLYVSGRISKTQLGNDVRELARDGGVTGLSIGYQPVRFHYDKDIRVLTEVEVHEVSLVAIPANDMARVTAAKSILQSGKVPDERELEAVLRAGGLSRRQAKRLLQHGYAGMTASHTAAHLLEQMADRLQR